MVNRPYLSLFVVALMTLSAARGGSELSHVTTMDHVPALALRLALIVVGVLALRAMWQRRANARGLTGLRAVLVVGLLVTQDIAVSFLRDGLAERLLATGLMAAIVAVVTWHVQVLPDRPFPAARSR